MGAVMAEEIPAQNRPIAKNHFAHGPKQGLQLARHVGGGFNLYAGAEHGRGSNDYGHGYNSAQTYRQHGIGS
ncbi:hypothetical protein JCM16816_13040 [Thermoanaerobacter brockii subsp. lactiethylicus]